MAKVQVRTMRLGYCDDKRQREGSVFYMDEKFMKEIKPTENKKALEEKGAVIVNGKYILPSWVSLVSKKKHEPEQDTDSKKIIIDDVI